MSWLGVEDDVATNGASPPRPPIVPKPGSETTGASANQARWRRFTRSCAVVRAKEALTDAISSSEIFS